MAPESWSRWRRAWLAWVLWALAIVGLVVTIWLDQLLRQTGRPELVVLIPTAIPPVLGAVSTATVGALVASRRPRHPVGWLLLGFGLSLSAAGVALAYTNYGVAEPDAPAAGLVALCVPATIVTAIACNGLILLLPDRVVAVAPVALVGGDHRGHTGRPAAGRDLVPQAR